MPVENNEPATGKKLGGVTGKGFMPGESGNPGGRPKKRLLDEVLEELLEADGSAEAVEIAKKLIAKARKDTKAAQLVAERTQGKPKQKVEHTGEDGGPIQASVFVSFVKPNGHAKE